MELLLKDLPIGTKIYEENSMIPFILAAKNHYDNNGVTIISDNVLMQACFDAAEPESENKRINIMGRGEYKTSNIHQWLNKEGLNWFVPTHTHDVAPSKENVKIWNNMYDNEAYNPYEEKEGFLSWFGKYFIQQILTTDVEVWNNDLNRCELVKAKAFLPSLAEMGCNTHLEQQEGKTLPLMKDYRMRYAMPSKKAIESADFRPSNFVSTDAWMYMLRSPHLNDPGLCTIVHSANPYSYMPASRPWMGVRPMINLNENTKIYKKEDKMIIGEVD